MSSLRNEEQQIPSACSNVIQTSELNEVQLSEGIYFWSADQEFLEEQALNEIVQFSKETVNENETNGDQSVQKTVASISSQNVCLDVNRYIKQQETYHIRQQHCASLKLIEDERIKELAAKKFTKRKVINGDNSTVSKRSKLVNEEEFGKNDSEEHESDYIPSEDELSGSDYEPQSSKKENRTRTAPRFLPVRQKVDKVLDDGLATLYKSRLNKYYKKLEKESSLLEPIVEDISLKGGLKVPVKLWDKLYGYQQDGINWLWEVHQKSTGGVLGDEMGLGKTVQIIVFLHALQYSCIRSCHNRFIGVGPSLVVCPATVIHQWVQHFHEWAPEFRVAILHQSGSFQGNKTQLIRQMHECKSIIVTTYLGILKFKGDLLQYCWHYIILDEGHKIRNPSAKVTCAVKELRTPHRIILTGSPMQNNLQELWSLFDYTNPGMLGSMATFMEHFANPILQGGFANASPMQEATALSVATRLKNIISSYLLRRMKAEVQSHIDLPDKTEQILFCSLSDEQRRLYMDYLMSEHVNMILGRGVKKWSSDNFIRGNLLLAITNLRKICNHPDISKPDDEALEENNENPEECFGYYKKSGKMVVVSALLKIWKKQKHRVLLFTQSRAMILIFQEFLRQQGYKFLKMDGSTSIISRQPLIDKFNLDESYDVFLLTTKVGGLGINLTGANRVIIYDPDWNPATDTQARERAWRIGQNKQVTIYRLLSAGTIEEKMYQRQVWKQLLSNKILIDPKIHRAFKASDLFDLFSLQEPASQKNPDSVNIFHDSRVRIQERVLEKKKCKKKKGERSSEDVTFSEDKIDAMKKLAQELAKSMTVEKKVVNKTTYQKELEEERKLKKKKKEELKKLSIQELLDLNREKAKRRIDDNINKVDDLDTSCTFAKALTYSEENSKLYRKIIEGKPVNLVNSNVEEGECSTRINESDKKVKHRKSREEKHKAVVIDESGIIDGEQVEGLVKTERKKMKHVNSEGNSSGDDYVLSKLFSKKGVSGALQHDSIVNGRVRKNNLRISIEAEQKADQSYEALRKSRVDNWRW